MVRERINPSELEKALEVLPEPRLGLVKLDWYRDLICNIVRAGEKTVPGIKLHNCGLSIKAWLTQPTKESIMDIYRQEYEKHEDYCNMEPIVELKWIMWESDNFFDKDIEAQKWHTVMTPKKGFRVEYLGEEPQYVSNLRQVLSGTRVPLKIVANDYSRFGG